VEDQTGNIAEPHRGFTLIELLVVISIIAILLGIFLPTLTMARESGRKILCATNLAQVGKAAHLYAHDYKGAWVTTYTPIGVSTPFHSDDKPWTGSGSPASFRQYGLTWKYYLNGDAHPFFCPSSTDRKYDDLTHGGATMGVATKDTFASYFYRGLTVSAGSPGEKENAPTTRDELHDRAMAADLTGLPGIPYRNHKGLINVLYFDGSVISLLTPANWYINFGNTDSYGGDSAAGAADGAWSRLDNRYLP
jgi:prepilin-type N-terminal cleavage/methylation domain-containing protein/prepilin-type processing-associated H-X9-DG protein